MILITWNVYRDNRRLISTVSNALSYDPDIVCFQEVPIERVSEILVIANEYISFQSNQDFVGVNFSCVRLCNLILIKKIKNPRFLNKIGSRRSGKQLPWLNRFRYEYVECNNLVVSMQNGSSELNVANVHMECIASPSRRIDLAKSIIDYLEGANDYPSVVCGDFNAFSNRYISPIIGPWCGYSLRDYMVSERRVLLSVFRNNGFKGCFDGVKTFKKFPAELDFVFFRNDINVNKKQVLKCRYTDHDGLLVDFG